MSAIQSTRLQVKSKRLRDVPVTFFKRKEGGCWVMDFRARGVHVERRTDCFEMGDAQAVAMLEIEKIQREHNGLAESDRAVVRQRGPVATVGDVLAALESRTGQEFFSNVGTRRTYATALRQLARAAVARGGDLETGRLEDVEYVRLDEVLTAGVIERFQAGRQGFEQAQARVALRENGGANTTVRNVRALFHREACRVVFKELKLPPLHELREVSMLKPVASRFVPWSEGAYAAFDAGAVALRSFDAAGVLRPGMLVRAVYLPRGHEAREVAGKAGVLLRTWGQGDQETGRVQWVWRGGEIVEHEMALADLRAVQVDYGELWLVNAMLRRLGLRSTELLDAQRHWLERRSDREGRTRWMLVLRDRPEERWKLPKNSAPRNLPLDDELAGLLLPRGAGPLIGPGMSETGRQDLVERLHNAWLRQFIPDRVKANHELRMWAGSLVYRQTGKLAEAQYFLGHCSQQTTEKYYSSWWQSSAMLDGVAVAVAEEVETGRPGDEETARLRAELARVTAELARLRGE